METAVFIPPPDSEESGRGHTEGWDGQAQVSDRGVAWRTQEWDGKDEGEREEHSDVKSMYCET